MTATTNFLPIIQFLQRSTKIYYCDVDKEIETELPKLWNLLENDILCALSKLHKLSDMIENNQRNQ